MRKTLSSEFRTNYSELEASDGTTEEIPVVTEVLLTNLHTQERPKDENDRDATELQNTLIALDAFSDYLHSDEVAPEKIDLIATDLFPFVDSIIASDRQESMILGKRVKDARYSSLSPRHARIAIAAWEQSGRSKITEKFANSIVDHIAIPQMPDSSGISIAYKETLQNGEPFLDVYREVTKLQEESYSNHTPSGLMGEL